MNDKVVVTKAHSDRLVHLVEEIGLTEVLDILAALCIVESADAHKGGNYPKELGYDRVGLVLSQTADATQEFLT